MKTLPRMCSFENCDKSSRSRGWCDTHYRRWKKYGDPAYSPMEDPVACEARRQATLDRNALTNKGRKSSPCFICGELAVLGGKSAKSGEVAHLECRRIRRDVGKETLCAYCGGEFEPTHSRGAWSKACSRSCARKLQWDNGEHPFQKKPRYGVMSADEAEARAFERGENARRRRRARLAGVERDVYTTASIAERDDCICHLCFAVVDMSVKWPDLRSPSVDHVLPLSLGGDDTLENVRLACLGCNLSKGNRV